jgi:anti-anti-sigma factor
MLAVSTHRSEPGVTALVLSNQVGIAEVRDLQAACLTALAESHTLRFDCRAVEHLEACVLQLLLAARTACQRRGGELVLEGLSAQVRKYIALAGLETALFATTDGPAPQVVPSES